MLLMDEPFAALDAHTRETMGEELLRIWQHSRKTVLFITHSADEAIMLSDRIIAMGRPPQGIIADLKVRLPRPRKADVRGLPRFSELGLEFVRCSHVPASWIEVPLPSLNHPHAAVIAAGLADICPLRQSPGHPRVVADHRYSAQYSTACGMLP